MSLGTLQRCCYPLQSCLTCVQTFMNRTNSSRLLGLLPVPYSSRTIALNAVQCSTTTRSASSAKPGINLITTCRVFFLSKSSLVGRAHYMAAVYCGLLRQTTAVLHSSLLWSTAVYCVEQPRCYTAVVYRSLLSTAVVNDCSITGTQWYYKELQAFVFFRS